MDLKSLTDVQLDFLLNEILAEQERRKAVAEIPEQIRTLTAKFVDGGGNVEDPS